MTQLKNLYPPDLWELIRKNKNYIPRQLKDNEKLKVFRRYWIPDFGICKVKDTINTKGFEYYSIIYGINKEKNGVISDSDSKEGYYELLKNFNNLEETKFINKNKPIYGAEIKYWFLINEIDFNDDDYSGYLDKIHNLKDTTKYIVKRNKKKEEYEFIII